MNFKKARGILLDWAVEEFYIKNKRLPDDFEEEQLEMNIDEESLRDAAMFINENEHE